MSAVRAGDRASLLSPSGEALGRVLVVETGSGRCQVRPEANIELPRAEQGVATLIRGGLYKFPAHRLRAIPAAEVELLPPNEWWDDLAEETQIEIQRLVLVAFKAEATTAFWQALPAEDKIRLMTAARNAAVDRGNREQRRIRQLAEAVERFTRAQGEDDKHEWESAHEHLISLAAEVLEGSPA